jgi:beta-lactamase superfamily II metal-dependent hydrolase
LILARVRLVARVRPDYGWPAMVTRRPVAALVAVLALSCLPGCAEEAGSPAAPPAADADEADEADDPLSSDVDLAPDAVDAAADDGAADGPSADADADADTDPERDADQGAPSCGEPPTPPAGRLWPVAGELYYEQLGLGGFKLGEAALVVGADGTLVLIDVGNDRHADDVRAALNRLVVRMSADGGFPPRALDSADHAVITHFHADHCDGLAPLLEDVVLSGRVIHRGFYDLTAAANAAAAGELCAALDARPGLERPLCAGAARAPCEPGSWTSTYPSTGCPGLDAGDLRTESGEGPAFVPLGAGGRLRVVGINGEMAGERYADRVGPIDPDDSNGENARSLVGLLEHGPFRLLVTGDLTGGGSDTPDMEGFYLPRWVDAIGAEGGDEGGIDVLHAGHHGRNTSSSQPWVEHLLPVDGASRNVVMGISTAHVNSPHGEVLERLASDDRLGEGRLWTTRVAPLGDRHPLLVDAGGGSIVVRTVEGGRAYFVQAVTTRGEALETLAFWSVASCR